MLTLKGVTRQIAIGYCLLHNYRSVIHRPVAVVTGVCCQPPEKSDPDDFFS